MLSIALLKKCKFIKSGTLCKMNPQLYIFTFSNVCIYLGIESVLKILLLLPPEILNIRSVVHQNRIDLSSWSTTYLPLSVSRPPSRIYKTRTSASNSMIMMFNVFCLMEDLTAIRVVTRYYFNYFHLREWVTYKFNLTFKLIKILFTKNLFFRVASV